MVRGWPDHRPVPLLVEQSARPAHRPHRPIRATKAPTACPLLVLRMQSRFPLFASLLRLIRSLGGSLQHFVVSYL